MDAGRQGRPSCPRSSCCSPAQIWWRMSQCQRGTRRYRGSRASTHRWQPGDRDPWCHTCKSPWGTRRMGPLSEWSCRRTCTPASPPGKRGTRPGNLTVSSNAQRDNQQHADEVHARKGSAWQRKAAQSDTRQHSAAQCNKKVEGSARQRKATGHLGEHTQAYEHRCDPCVRHVPKHTRLYGFWQGPFVPD